MADGTWKKRVILMEIRQHVSDLVYKDRKGDERLTLGAFNSAFKDGIITIDEAVEEFRKGLEGVDK